MIRSKCDWDWDWDPIWTKKSNLGLYISGNQTMALLYKSAATTMLNRPTIPPCVNIRPASPVKTLVADGTLPVPATVPVAGPDGYLTERDVCRDTTGPWTLLLGATTVAFDRMGASTTWLLLGRLARDEVLYGACSALVVAFDFTWMAGVWIFPSGWSVAAVVGRWTRLSVACASGCLVAADAPWGCEMDPDADADADGLGAVGFALEMPNWVEYWNWPVPVTMICSP